MALSQQSDRTLSPNRPGPMMHEPRVRRGTLDGASGSSAGRPGMREHIAAASADLRRGLSEWRLWLVLGVNDVRQRYHRSLIGQFWITVSMLVTIGALGLVYSYLFRLSVRDYLPSLAIGIVVWALISSIVIDACSVFTGSEAYLRQVPMPKSIFVHRMLVRNLLTFAHNASIVPLLYLFFGIRPGWTVLLAPLGLLIVVVAGIWIGLLVGTLCARFRDLPQIVASAMQIAFFVTPVMWKPDQLPPQVAWIVEWNPLANWLGLIREPLFGAVPPASAYANGIAVLVIGFLVTIPIFARYRARIVYWL
jgi:ABC-type polysaccharide/polyol phosphate export permease